MKFQDIVNKLFASDEFKKFKEEKPDAFPCSGFFSVDVNEKDNKQHIDYYVPSENKVYSFKMEAGCEKLPTEFQDNKKPQKVSLNYDFDFNELKKLIKDKMNEQGLKNKIQKYLYSFQHSPETGKDYLLGTIFISGLALLKIEINIEEKKIESFEKKSFMQMMNVFKNKRKKYKRDKGKLDDQNKKHKKKDKGKKTQDDKKIRGTKV